MEIELNFIKNTNSYHYSKNNEKSHNIQDIFFIKNQLKISINNKNKLINITKNNIIYFSPNDQYDIMIIKLNEEDNINEYLELDEKIFNNDSEIYNRTKYVYMLSFSYNEEKPKISFGNLLKKEERNFDITYTCVSGLGSAGAPILDYYSNKVIGIHTAARRKRGSNEIDYRIGTFLKYPLDELNKKN